MENSEWKNSRDVRIPPVEQKGFREEILIRKPIPPREESAADTLPREKAPAAGPLPQEEDPDDATVLLVPEQRSAWVRRESTGEQIPVEKDYFVMGKRADCDYVITGNSTVSRNHAAIRRSLDGYWLEDLNSSNGTFVKGKQIREPEALVSGTEFQLSREKFVFLTEE